MSQFECPQCGGDGTLLGQLGTVHHLRCRDCGWDYSVMGGVFEDEDEDEPEDDGQPDELQEWHDFDPDC